ncbi:hypothetical protein [Dyadobacter sp. 22481]|uniref:hypothetical protein n=1 Tax=Dyadobacter sp. 22481 TaxID=3453926 RepID=UPI003F86B990
MILDWIKRTPVQPSPDLNYPIYLRTGSEHYFVKIKSPTEYTWLVRIDSENFNAWASGSAESHPDEYFDIEHLIKLCIVIKEKDYMTRLAAMIDYYAGMKNRLKL